MARKQYFTVRLNKIRIIENREWGAAEVKILSFVTAGNDSLPVLEGYLETDSETEKKSIIKQAINYTKQVVYERHLIQLLIIAMCCVSEVI